MADRICVAQIGAAHGTRGEVRLRSFTEDPTAVTSYGPLESEDGTRRFIERDLLPLGLRLQCFARAPYLSAGDSARSLYELDDVVVVLSKSSKSA